MKENIKLVNNSNLKTIKLNKNDIEKLDSYKISNLENQKIIKPNFLKKEKSKFYYLKNKMYYLKEFINLKQIDIDYLLYIQENKLSKTYSKNFSDFERIHKLRELYQKQQEKFKINSNNIEQLNNQIIFIDQDFNKSKLKFNKEIEKFKNNLEKERYLNNMLEITLENISLIIKKFKISKFEFKKIFNNNLN